MEVTMTSTPGSLAAPVPHHHAISIDLLPGPLGVGIQYSPAAGGLVVSSKANAASPLQVHDVIVSMNGIKLMDVEGGLHACVKLFQAFGSSSRTLMVHRPELGHTHPGIVSPLPPLPPLPVPSAAAVVKKEPAGPLATLSATVTPAAPAKSASAATAAAANAASTHHQQWNPSAYPSTPTCETKTCDQCKQAKPRSSYKDHSWYGYAKSRICINCRGPSNATVPQPNSYAAQAKKHALKTSTKHNAAAAKKQKVVAKSYTQQRYSATPTTATANKDNFQHDEHYMKMAKDGFPKPGFVSPCLNYYITERRGECYRTISEKLGLEQWRELDKMPFNKKFFGSITANTIFLGNTIVQIPTQYCSKWKLSKLVDNHVEEVRSMGTCSKCLKKEQPHDTDQMLICDGCDALVHTSCAGLNTVPTGDWLCEGCLEVLAARRKSNAGNCPRDEAGKRSLEAKLPPLPKLDAQTLTLVGHAEKRFREEIALRKQAALNRLAENQRVLATALKERIARLTDEIQRSLEQASENARSQSTTDRLNELKEDLEQALIDENDRPGMEREDMKQVLLDFAKLLSEPRLNFETMAQYRSRFGCDPLFLGVAKVEEPDIRALNILREPTELVLSIPVNATSGTDAQHVECGKEYYLFGTVDLFSVDRNDYTPMDFSPTSTRTAQRDLMAILMRDPRNKSLQVSRSVVPTSVSLRGTSDEPLSVVTKCFDLSDLVRDCHYPIQNQPAAETPKRLADNGLVLRDYQKTSLRWLIDKESNPTGMGSSGELWSRMRCLRQGTHTNNSYFFCELTGSIVREIFDYHADVAQKDASKLGGDTFPSAAIIGSEMGLGKTVIALSLVIASPPSLQNRILPREYIAKINHPAYVPPASVVKCTSSTNNTSFLSNATLVIAPMTLCPQWQTEIQRFAPWMSFVTLHNDETESVAEIASKDIVVVSTFMMSQPTGKAGAIMKKLRQIHFHRIFLDESHYNNTGERVKLSLAQLSSTHRYCVTGTPVGHSLADLYGQLRFLRVPQFCRPDFWQQCIDQPYSEHNCYALNVLRSLLSRIVIRHSKEQTLNNGNALVTLPPRSVETLLLPFGSDAEKKVYDYIESRNKKRFMELRSESPGTVMGKYMDLTGMLYSGRQACCHPSLVNLDSLQNVNEKIHRDRRVRLGQDRFQDTEFSNKKKSTCRADVFQEAVSKARPSAEGRTREAVLQFQEGEVQLECPVCLETTGEGEVALTPCAHTFCVECILSCMKSTSSSREPSGACPECRETILRSEITFLGDAKESKVTPKDDEKPKANENNESSVDINGFHLSMKDTLTAASGASGRRIVYEPLNENERRQQRAFCHTLPPDFLNSWNVSSTAIGTKIARLLEEIKAMMQKDPTAKAVVFSQFLGVLDVAGQELVVRDIRHARVDGMMKQHHRADAIQSFTNDPNTRVLLLSMRAGAAGLNLMAANYCFLMDPAMNSAVEEQAIDRIHRIGQTRPVFVKRLIIKDTIEERILETRRSLAADRPAASTQLDGTSLMEEDDSEQPKKRDRHEDENEMGEKTFHRLRQLEALFGCSTTVKGLNA